MPDERRTGIPHSVPDLRWPGGAQCAVMLTFDFDAETLWISRDASNWKRPGTLSQGTYGARVAVPKILELLRELELRGTFFVPGWTAERHTDRVAAILECGHEVGHHGYLHEWINPDDPAAEEAALDRGLEALRKTVGVKPVGYRSPAGETSGNLIRLLAARSGRAAVALVARRRRLHAVLDQEPAADLHQRAYPQGVDRRVHRDLPLGRPV
jgi:peptidoglycan/xylan/chitin deacetylase (PgdA/CDA1 family)